MRLEIKRDKGEQIPYTLGSLFVDGIYFCDTLEDMDRGLTQDTPLEEIKQKKVYGQTAIPTGEYSIDLSTVSPKFKDRSWAKFCEGRLPRLLNVPGYEGVLIHVGNKPEDTLGCILVGKKSAGGTLVDSTKTFQKLYNIMLAASRAGQRVFIAIS